MVRFQVDLCVCMGANELVEMCVCMCCVLCRVTIANMTARFDICCYASASYILANRLSSTLQWEFGAATLAVAFMAV